MIHWLTTLPSPRARATGFDAGQRGWRLHAVEAPDEFKFSELNAAKHPALCGIIPRHGWGLDMFIERKCSRCVKKAQVPNGTSQT
jgi:hypothetical protein